MSDFADLRAKVTRRTHNVLFAKAQVSGADMGEIVREVLDKWAASEIHAATVIARMAHCEGAIGESDGFTGASAGAHAPSRANDQKRGGA